ncbi:MAG: L,D-transpeptidase family protein [Verrucomicrobiota bacterium]
MYAKIIAIAALTLLASCGYLLPPNQTTNPPPALPAPNPTQPTWTIHQSIYDALEPGTGHIEISLAEQRLTLLNPDGIPALETDCSTGIPGKSTPTGSFRILEMIVDKRSNKYGQYVSKETGEVVAAQSWTVSKPPPGSQFLGTPMPYWMRLTWYGVGIHVGNFPRGQRSSFGCIRMPADLQPLLYEKCRLGTRVTIQ